MAGRHALIGAALALLSGVLAHPPSFAPTTTRTATPNPKAPCPGSVLFDNTKHLTSLVNGLPDFLMEECHKYIFIFNAPCNDCVLSYQDVGLYLRKKYDDDVSIEAELKFVDLNPDGSVDTSTWTNGAPSYTSYFDLTDTPMPYTIPYRGVLYIPTGNTKYIALVLKSDEDVWWRFPSLIPAVPVGNTPNVTVYNFQYGGVSVGYEVYAENPPKGTDYFPSIYFGGGPQCAPTPSASVTRSPSTTASASRSITTSVSPTPSITASGTPSASETESIPDRLLEEVNNAAPARAREMWDSPTPSCSATVTSTVSPCAGIDHVSYFNNIYEELPILELLDEVRLKARQPFAIVFRPPCVGCTIELEGLDMILKATESSPNASLAIRLCQYDSSFSSVFGCRDGATNYFGLEDLPTLVTISLDMNYTVPSHEHGDLKLILTPNVDMQWMMSGLAPNKPGIGVSHPSRVQVQPFCEDLTHHMCYENNVLAAHNSPHTCPDSVPNWVDLGIWPSMHLFGYVPCFVHPRPCALYDPLNGPSDNALLAQQCYDDCTPIIVDTIKNVTLTNTAAMQVLPKTHTYTVWFENPCFGIPDCAIDKFDIVLPLQALTDFLVDIKLKLVTSGDLVCDSFDSGLTDDDKYVLDYTFERVYLPDNDLIKMVEICFNTFLAGSSANATLGIQFSFSRPLLWHYGLPLVSFGLADLPMMVIDSEDDPCYHGFVLPGVRISAKQNTTCIADDNSVFANMSVADAHTLIDFCEAPYYYPTPIRPPIDCFGTGQITVADNTLKARFLFESGTILEPYEVYAIEFGLPCTRCVVHLTHLTLPLSLMSAGLIEFNINVVILAETTPGVFEYLPEINAEWVDISTKANVYLTTTTGFYTIPLPDSFTLAALPDARLRYVMRFTVSNYVMIHDGLVPPQFPVTHDNTTDPYARLLLETECDVYERSPEVPGFWIRSWADPFAECIPSIPSPSSTPPPSGGGVSSPSMTTFPIASPHVPTSLPSGIIAFISFEIIIWIPSFSPLDLFGDASFLFIFRLVIALFFGVPMGDVHLGDCYRMPGHTLWMSQPPFGAATRRLEFADMRVLQDATGMSTRVNIVSGRSGEADRTDELLAKLFSDDANEMVDDLLAYPAVRDKGLTSDNLEIDRDRVSYVGGSPSGGVSGSGNGTDLSGGAIAGIVVGCLVAAALVALGVVGYQRWANGEENNATNPSGRPAGAAATATGATTATTTTVEPNNAASGANNDPARRASVTGNTSNNAQQHERNV